MLVGPEDWRTRAADELLDAIVALPDREEAARFMRDLCTLRELRELAQRWAVVRLLDEGRHYSEIARETGASTATITRIAAWLHHGTGGYRSALARDVRRRRRGSSAEARAAAAPRGRP
ncbi:MAG TPA: YerC/YecD family TrpR-related protein [Candidatus Limnocylindrales bacterium]|nr:YerC/YecD family TrpR-related protein [Candidatus Limnocylindrales bacterium]